MGNAGDKLLPWGQSGKLRHRMQQPPHQTDDDEEQDRAADREVPGYPAFIQRLAADMGHDRTNGILHRKQQEDQPVQALCDDTIAGSLGMGHMFSPYWNG